MSTSNGNQQLLSPETTNRLPQEQDDLQPPPSLLQPNYSRNSYRTSYNSSAYYDDHQRYSAFSNNPLIGDDDDADNLTQGQAGIVKGPKDYRAVGKSNTAAGRSFWKTKRGRFLIIIVLFAILVVAVMVPISQTVLKNNRNKQSENQGNGDSNSDSDSSGGGNGNGNGASPHHPSWGTNGSIIEMGNGKKFTYLNSFGGRWVSDPLNNTAQAQNYTPPLTEEFDFGKNRILGVNLGGWLVTEPFISPALYQPFENDSSPAIDEFTLCEKWASQPGGRENVKRNLIQHYETFIDEQDFAEIAAAGLNWIRLPIGFWAIETFDNEPFLESVSWDYFVKAIQWARKYGLRINLDLHSVPGSQNGYNHSGRLGWMNWLTGSMGYANSQRTLDYIRRITQFINQPEIRNVVPIFSIVNEPRIDTIGTTWLRSFYAQVYQTIRQVTGYGQSQGGPMIMFHDGFTPLSNWYGFLYGTDRVAWDTHPYICFGPQNNDPWDLQTLKPCNAYTTMMDSSQQQLGVTVGGETSLAINDCGLYLNGVNQGSRYDGTFFTGEFQRIGSCQPFIDWQNYDSQTKLGLKKFSLSLFDSLHHFYFWTWKIGPSLKTGLVESPFWSYQLGWKNGWLPLHPLLESKNACQIEATRQNTTVPISSFFSPSNTNPNTYLDWQIGKAQNYSTPTFSFPPSSSSLVNDLSVSQLPRYTQIPTTTTTMTRWNNDSSPFYAPIQGCPYPADQYNLNGWIPNGWPCGSPPLSS